MIEILLTSFMYSARPRNVYFIENQLLCFLSYLLVGIDKFLEPNFVLKMDIYNRDCSFSPNNCQCPDSPSTVFKPTDMQLLRFLVF
jgi:hypothetical protein